MSKKKKSKAKVDVVIDPADLRDQPGTPEYEAKTVELEDAAERLRKKIAKQQEKERAERTAIKARPWTIEITITEGVLPKGAVRTTTIADGHMTHGLDYDLLEERELLIESIQPVLATVIRKHTWSVKGYRDLGDTSFLSES